MLSLSDKKKNVTKYKLQNNLSINVSKMVNLKTTKCVKILYIRTYMKKGNKIKYIRLYFIEFFFNLWLR